jgi:hypothetical protein
MSIFRSGCVPLVVPSLEAMWKTSNGDRNNPRRLRPHVLIIQSSAMLHIPASSRSLRIQRQRSTSLEPFSSSANAYWHSTIVCHSSSPPLSNIPSRTPEISYSTQSVPLALNLISAKLRVVAYLGKALGISACCSVGNNRERSTFTSFRDGSLRPVGPLLPSLRITQ